MNAAEFFAAAAKLPVGTLADVTGGGGLVVVAPHPDDESLGCGGLIAEACACGLSVRLIVVSDGVGSHPNSKRYPPHRLRALREEETRQAAAQLGLDAAAIRFLRLPDRFVASTGADADLAQDAILAAVHETKAGALCVTWRYDPHCDHSACAALVAGVRAQFSGVRCFSYPIWGSVLTAETEVGAAPKGLRLDVRRHAQAKAAAIAAHRSQTTGLIDDDPDGFRLTPDMIERCSGDYELFVKDVSESDRHERTLPPAYFDRLYARDPDPWRFASSAYEQAKYAATLAALPRARYRSAFEVGCSIGVLTRMLAARVDALLAVDVAAGALDQARERCAGFEHVGFDALRVPAQWPQGRFDLIVLSEIVYYLDRPDVARLAERVRTSILPDGDIILVHWLGETHYPLTGDQAAELFRASTVDWAMELSGRIETNDYRLDVLRAREAN